MWECTPAGIEGGRGQRYMPLCDGRPVPYRDVLRLWQQDESFRRFFVALLTDAPVAGYRWETPPVSRASADRHFEFVLLDAPRIGREPDPDAFADPFRSHLADRPVAAFPNLGKDAILVVPRPLPGVPHETYVHLAAFVRGAPAAQVHELWRAVGAAMETRLGDAPAWLSTAGMGVAWLHIRLDARPKYYGFQEYVTAGR